MTIFFDSLFIQTKNGFVCRVAVQIPGLKVPLQQGENTDAVEAAGINIYQWVGRRLDVSVRAGVHAITGLSY
ncbi:hypothetical protein GCM10027299_41950 [Larkinella ripae]